ncbi:MAG: PrsW family glutamic-type intramembrane protease [Gemmataceae bacterium]
MSTPEHDPSIAHEPHLRGLPFRPDPSEETAKNDWLCRDPAAVDEDRAEQSVWDEPGFSAALAGPPPPDAWTYCRWLQQRRAATTAAQSWGVTGAIALLAGPVAILSAFLSVGYHTYFAVVNLTVIGPLIEEVGKVAAALWVIEKRPYLFTSRLQIGCCVVAGGLVFAGIENLLYLHVYLPEASPLLVLWRWTVCVALHTGCSLVAGLGLMRVWHRTMTTWTKANLSLAVPFLMAAVVIHGLYNGMALLLEGTVFRF